MRDRSSFIVCTARTTGCCLCHYIHLHNVLLDDYAVLGVRSQGETGEAPIYTYIWVCVHAFPLSLFSSLLNAQKTNTMHRKAHKEKRTLTTEERIERKHMGRNTCKKKKKNTENLLYKNTNK